MNCLFLDLASHNGLIACVADDAVAASQAVDHRLGDHELVPAVETLLKKAGWMYPDLTGIACVVGPGGFTSLRVAVAFANTLAWSVPSALRPSPRARASEPRAGPNGKIKSAGVHLSDLYGARFPSPPQPPPPDPPSPRLRWAGGRGGSAHLLWLHSTKKNELFIRGFGSCAQIFPEAVCITVDDFRSKIQSGTFWTGELIPEHQKIAQEMQMKPMEIEPLEEILPAFVQSLSFKSQTLLPWYGRGW